MGTKSDPASTIYLALLIFFLETFSVTVGVVIHKAIRQGTSKEAAVS